jgi:SAM-dependent methyltransferase
LQRFKPIEAYACAESIFDLPFQRKTFDSIIYFGLATSVDQKHARLLLCDAARVVKPNGIVAFIVGPSSGGASSVIGPAWTRGEFEKPAGQRDMGGWTSAFYTPEQQLRLRVDEYGAPLSGPKGAPLNSSQESFTDSGWLKNAASNCGFEVLSFLSPGTSFSGFLLHKV